MVCPKVVSRVTRWVYGINTQKRRDPEARPQPAPAPKTSREASECLIPYRLVTVRAPRRHKTFHRDHRGAAAGLPEVVGHPASPAKSRASSRRPSTAGSPSRPRSSFARSPAPRAPAGCRPALGRPGSPSSRRAYRDAARAKVTCREPANCNWGNSGYGWFLAQWFRHLRIVGSTTSFKYREPMDFPHQADWPAADGWLKVRMSTRSPAIRATSGIAGPS